MALRTLKPRLATLNPTRAAVLQAKAGTTPRMVGEKLTKLRRVVLLEGNYGCVDCGRISESNHIDHDIPLEQGGTYDRENLKIRCVECHAIKTRRELQARWAATR